jgi:hypothetical protein
LRSIKGKGRKGKEKDNLEAAIWEKAKKVWGMPCHARPCCSSDQETRKAEREGKGSEWQRLCWRVVAVAHQPSPNVKRIKMSE